MLPNTDRFRDKMRQGQVCLGTCITFSDPTVTEALSGLLDFVWIDMEHNPLTLEAVQGHILATKGTGTVPLVRVPWNDPVLIKPVLDVGAAGVIVPLIRTADDARRAVAACRYPPEGIRGFGPRRPSGYGRIGGAEFCRAANEAMITIVQIEHKDAVTNLDDILTVPGLTGIVIGPNDLAGSMGHMGEPRHPDVLRTIEQILANARRKGVFAGLAFGDEPAELVGWVKKGAQWLAIGADFLLLVKIASQIAGQVRERLSV
jgi:2-dehydro-3-deoxyglucarate aldolase/4-hydroxy-2-oxoheptanedioate aldolase